MLRGNLTQSMELIYLPILFGFVFIFIYFFFSFYICFLLHTQLPLITCMQNTQKTHKPQSLKKHTKNIISKHILFLKLHRLNTMEDFGREIIKQHFVTYYLYDSFQQKHNRQKIHSVFIFFFQKYFLFFFFYFFHIFRNNISEDVKKTKQKEAYL